MSMASSLASSAVGMLTSALGNPHPEPNYKISIDGRDITPTFNARLISLTLTDNRGFEADTLDLTLDDSDGKLSLPARGVSISVALGWMGSPLVDKGSYTVDEVEHSGAPDQLTIRAKSADLRAGLATKQERSWDGQSLGNIVKSIAAAHGITPMVASSLAGQLIDHVDQTNESDANLLTRIAREFDAIVTVKKGMLLCMPIGECASVTGIPFPTSTLVRSSGDAHRFAMAERDTYTAVRAYYQDVRAGATGDVTVGAEGVSDAGRKEDDQTLQASAVSTKVLRHTYSTKANATRGAQAEWQRLQRGLATFSFTAAKAHPELFPELPVTVSGFKPEIDGTSWIITRCVHNLSSSGFTTALELEIKPAEMAG